jgi:integrase
MARPLTVQAIEYLEPGKARREIPDGHTRGLWFVLQPSGAMSWAVRYRMNGKPRKLTLGPYPTLDLKAARHLARVALVKVANGNDPAVERQAAKAARCGVPDDLVEAVVAAFIERYARPNTKERTWRETERLLRKELLPWHGRRLSEISKADVHILLDGIMDRPTPIVANKTFAALRRMCGWAVERGLLNVSPCAGLKPPGAEKSRDRYLSDEEITQLWHATEIAGWPFGPIAWLLLLTGQRLREVAGMRWAELNFGEETWTIPNERTKNGIVHIVPLAPQTTAFLRSLPNFAGAEGLVFTTNERTAVSGFSRAKRRIDELLPDLEPWTFHDLRRTAATGLQRLGVRLEVTEAILNHVSGSRAGITGVYQRHDWRVEKRDAAELWARHIEQLCAGKGGPFARQGSPIAQQTCSSFLETRDERTSHSAAPGNGRRSRKVRGK